MRDYVFEEMLNRRANVTRPVVTTGGDLLPREPEYGLERAAAPLRVRLVRASLDTGLLGAFLGAEAVGYALAGTAQAHDRLGVIVRTDSLQSKAEAEDRTLRVARPDLLARGQRLHLRDVAAFAEVVVEEVQGPTVKLTAALGQSFGAGVNVEPVESWEVLGVEDAAGAGHHQRLALRRRV